jgi:hypothetical protein
LSLILRHEHHSDLESRAFDGRYIYICLKDGTTVVAVDNDVGAADGVVIAVVVDEFPPCALLVVVAWATCERHRSHHYLLSHSNGEKEEVDHDNDQDGSLHGAVAECTCIAHRSAYERRHYRRYHDQRIV